MQQRIEFDYERTSCDCGQCKSACRFLPGYLVPGDLGRMIPPFMQPLAWAEQTLLASPGALVMKSGRMFRIPTLVPCVKSNGECIHLLPDSSCGIHPVAPFGCAFFNVCEPERDHLSNKGMEAVYRAWLEKPESLYQRIWHHLFSLNKIQKHAEVLREKWVNAI